MGHKKSAIKILFRGFFKLFSCLVSYALAVKDLKNTNPNPKNNMK